MSDRSSDSDSTEKSARRRKRIPAPLPQQPVLSPPLSSTLDHVWNARGQVVSTMSDQLSLLESKVSQEEEATLAPSQPVADDSDSDSLTSSSKKKNQRNGTADRLINPPPTPSPEVEALKGQVETLQSDLKSIESKLDRFFASSEKQFELQKQQLMEHHQQLLDKQKEQLLAKDKENKGHEEDLQRKQMEELLKRAKENQEKESAEQKKRIQELEEMYKKAMNQVKELEEQKKRREEMEMILSDDSESDIYNRTLSTSLRATRGKKPSGSNVKDNVGEKQDDLEHDSLTLDDLGQVNDSDL